MKYKRKSIETVEAIQWLPGISHPAIVEEYTSNIDAGLEGYCRIQSIPGLHRMLVLRGWYIIDNLDGTYSVSTQDQFEEFYEAV